MPATGDHDDQFKSSDRPDGEDRLIGRPYSRVESEVLEILQRKDRPLSFSEHVRRKAARARRQRLERAALQVRHARAEAGPGTFLVACLVLALLGYFLRDVSALLASILALASVVCLFWPIVMRFRRPAGSNNKRWRGRDMDYYATPAEPPRWVRNLQDRFRRPPRP